MGRPLSFTRLARLAWITLVFAGCRTVPDVVVIGFAAPPSDSGVVTVTREELAQLPAIAGGLETRLDFVDIGIGVPADIQVQRATDLVRVPGLVGVVGHGGSRPSLAAAPVYNAAEVPQIVPTGTSRRLRDAGPWTLRLAPDDSIEGAFIGRFVADRLGAHRVTLFYQNDEYGSGIRDGVITALGLRGIAVQFVAPVDSLTDFATLVDASLAAGVPDAVISGARARETGTIARLMRRSAPRSRVVVGDGALPLPVLAREAGPAVDAVYVVSFWMADATDSLSRAFVARYRRLVGVDPVGAQAMSHDGLMLLAQAIREVGQDRPAIRAYLLSLGRGRPPYLGVTGPISFQADRAERLVMMRMQGGVARRVANFP